VADGGERLVDAAFNRRAALGGSGAAFNSIVAGGAHATMVAMASSISQSRGALVTITYTNVSGTSSRSPAAVEQTRARFDYHPRLHNENMNTRGCHV